MTNYIKKDLSEQTKMPQDRAVEQLQQQLPYSRIVRITFTDGFSQPASDSEQGNIFAAGNDKKALETVSELMKVAGLNPIITNDLNIAN